MPPAGAGNWAIRAGRLSLMDAEVHEDLRFVVANKTVRTPSIVQLDLSPLDQPLTFRPGQYVLLSDIEGRLPQRSFSIASAPRADGHIAVLVTRVLPPGLTSSWVHDGLRTGDYVLISGPYGTFTQGLPIKRPVLHLSAGSGLAPIMALIEVGLASGTSAPITLFFSAHTAADVYNEDVFADWAARHANFTYMRTLTREPDRSIERRIPDLLPKVLPDLRGFEVFIAGSEGFVLGCEVAVMRQGARPINVHTEPFFAEPQPRPSVAFPRIGATVG